MNLTGGNIIKTDNNCLSVNKILSSIIIYQYFSAVSQDVGIYDIKFLINL